MHNSKKLNGKGTRKSPFTPNPTENMEHFLTRIIFHGAQERTTKTMFAQVTGDGSTNLVSIRILNPTMFDSKFELVENDTALQNALKLAPGKRKPLWFWKTVVIYRAVANV